MKTQNQIPVFYSPKMIADSQSISPSAAKPAKVVDSWLSKFDVKIIEPTPVTTDQIAFAHDRSFVSGVLQGNIDNGFGNRSLEVALSLPYTSGAMLSAARHAILTKGVAAAPCSGFHHAGYASSEGFCTFNGLMISAISLLEEGIKNIGILDFDMHFGNGTEDIINYLDLRREINHYTAGHAFYSSDQAHHFFKILPSVLKSMLNCEVILYQAGADPHINDPYGGWLTTEQLKVRDGIVFDFCKKHEIPIAWNLAGGYQTELDGSIPKVLEIHDNTMSECVRVYA